MYKVRNGTGGVLPLQLEKGSIMMQPGATYDLDGVCSRNFINDDPTLRDLITHNHLILIHDSEQGVPQQPTWNVMKKAKRKTKQVPKPVVVDFSNVPEPEKELPLEVLVEKVENLKKEEAAEATKEVADEPKEEHECPVCGRGFKSARGLMSHSRVHKTK